MRAGRFLLGVAAGAGVAYALVRTVEALRAVQTPVVQSSSDSARYGRMRRALAAAGAARSLIGTLAFAYGPLALRLERGLTPVPRWLRPALFFGGATLAGAIVDLPIEFVEDYVLEKRFGLSDQEPRDWLSDSLKSTAIGAGLSAFLGTLGVAALRRFPKAWPLVASIGLLPLLILANIIVPIYILPLYNKFEALGGPLEQRLRALASRFGVGDAEILRMDMSRQTKKANAFVTGIGSTHRIVLGDTLVDHFEADEVEFVVAHELGHYVTKDTWRMIAAAEISAMVLLFLASRVTRTGEVEDSVAVLRIYALLAAGLQLLRPVLNAFSRSREWAADRFALSTTNDGQAGAAAFRRLRDQNLAEDEIPKWYEIIFASHPSLGDRIEALERT